MLRIASPLRAAGAVVAVGDSAVVAVGAAAAAVGVVVEAAAGGSVAAAVARQRLSIRTRVPSRPARGPR